MMQVRRILSFSGVPPFAEDIWLRPERFKEPDGGPDGELPLAPPVHCLELDFGVRMVRAEEKSAPCCPTVSRQNGCMSAGNTAAER